uniref:vicilin-like seed storage protein At2g28490 n=1 Tax=Erigeron canadensis TaxID=72917 RepID=UPI001CB9881C|nr:vicilin-like seed storage protein At2g28490 [Erigeron canadensis]
MAKVTSKLVLVLFLLAVIVVAGVKGQGSGTGWQGSGTGWQQGGSGTGWQQGGDHPREHEGKGEGRFPPEGGYGGGGQGGWQGGDHPREHEGKGEGRFPPEGGRGRGGGGGRTDYPPEGGRGTGEPGGRGRVPRDTRRYILSDMKSVVATDAGGMRVVKGVGGPHKESPMHIGFITMEPNSMFIPQYLDSSLILFVEQGEARIGSIFKDDFVEQDLKAGDIYRIQSGSVFYLVNRAQGQRLHIITSIDTAESNDWHSFQAYFIGGGTNPKSVLAGFDIQTIATAFNVSSDVVGELLSSRQQQGAIVYLSPEDVPQKEPSTWKKFLDLGTNERKTQMKKLVHVPQKVEEEKPAWSFGGIFNSVFGNKKDSSDKKLGSYNIYDRKADFRNDYGWSVEVNGDDYEPLKWSDFAVYLVNLTAGSMMAPHINPSAIEYGVVLSGTGNIQVVFPNGTLAMDAEVTEGDVFWIPRYFAFCQVASRTGPFVFFGFTTSAQYNYPQFLAGQGSVLQAMLSPELAAAFDLSESRMSEIINAQSQSTIFPSASASPGGGDEEIPEGEAEGSELLMRKMGSKIRMKKSSFAYNMAMGMN